MAEKRKCSNCAFCERLKLLGDENVMRCWHEPVMSTDSGKRGIRNSLKRRNTNMYIIRREWRNWKKFILNLKI